MSGYKADAKFFEDLFFCSDGDFIPFAYRTLLGRAPDLEGLANYLAAMRSGATRTEILTQLSNSEEAVALNGSGQGSEIDVHTPSFADKLALLQGRLQATSSGDVSETFPVVKNEGQSLNLAEVPSLPVGVVAGEMLAKARRAQVDFGVISDTRIEAEQYSCDPKVIAFYLPQYHRVKENDEWWGPGFTEWTNVRKAKPNYEGHRQPHIPEAGDYYDLIDPSVQRRQSALAKEYGIKAFCYYMYWFDGRRVLETPLDQMLADKEIELEFCVCWANENWTRTWDGKANDILLGQIHTPETDRRFIRDALKYFHDPRYLRIDGKLALLVYRVDLLPNCRETAEIWRDEVRKAGLGELHLCAVQFYGVTNPEPWGFDAAVEFPPHGWLVPENLPDTPPKVVNPKFKGHIFDYQKTIDWALSKAIPNYTWYRGVFPGWDNTARRQDTPHIFAGSDPWKFEVWLTEVIRQTIIMAPVEHQVVFINAWNEWGEGAHLEPDQHDGRLNLMALNSAIATAKREAWPLRILGRLRNPGAYPDRQKDERALLNLLRAHEKAFGLLTSQLRSTGVNPFA